MYKLPLTGVPKVDVRKDDEKIIFEEMTAKNFS